MNVYRAHLAAALVVLSMAASASAQVTRPGETFSAIPFTSRGNSIAFDSRNNVYLAVETFGVLRGRFINPDGVVLGDAFIIQSTGFFTHFPDVAYSPDADGGAGAFLVTWHESDATPTSVHARMVSFTRGIISADVTLARQESYWEAASEPSIAYASVSREFLVTWRHINYDIRAARVDLAGNLIGAVFSITADLTGVFDQYPRAAYNPLTDEFMVGWSATVSFSSLKVQRVKAGSGALLGGAQTVATAVSIFANELTYEPATNRYLATWYQDPPKAIFGRMVNADGTPAGVPTPLTSRYRAYDGLGVAFNPVSGSFFAVSHDSLTPEDGGVEVSPNATPVAAEQQVTISGGTGNFHPQIAGNTARDEWMVVASRSFTQLIGQRLKTATRFGPPPPPPNPCTTVSINPTALNVPAASGSSSFSITVDPAGCTWTATSNASWLNPSASSGTGATLNFTWAANGSVVGRSGAITISGLATFSVAQQGQSTPLMNIDIPQNGQTIGQPFLFAGWALDLADPSGPGMDLVHVYAYGPFGPVFLGSASYGVPRPDVAAAFGQQFAHSGFQLVVRGLTPANYLIVAYGHSSVTGGFNIARVIAVTVVSTVSMNVDNPGNGPLGNNVFTVSGWAFDQASVSGTGVDAVHVYAYPAPSGNPIFLGAAQLGIERSDIAATFGSQFLNSGWGLSATLPPGSGSYLLVVFVHSTVSNAFDKVQLISISVP